MANEATLYHLALRDEWDAAARDGKHYHCSTIGRSLDEVGYIHCSFAHQVQPVADMAYTGRDDVVLLVIDRSQIDSEVRVEALVGDEEFPHIYGPLPIAAVVDVRPVPQGTDGRLQADAAVGHA
jgi:uncharacterized protein (DUF952 family)